MRSDLRLLFGVLALATAFAPGSAAAQQQDIGHKVLGTIGLLAGAQPQPGVYLAGRFFYYAANELVDRDGNSLPVGLDIDAWAVAVGLRATFPVKPLAATWSASFGVPLLYSRFSTEQPQASLDRFGIADLYLTPALLGWRLPRFDVVAGYGLYAPTGRFEPGGSENVGRGHWTHQFSLGGTADFDAARAWHLSALGSYDLNMRNRGIDITRGDTVQVQGGLGGRLGGILTLGLVGYALWQVTDDSGADLPPVLRGARDRAFGLGPEVSVLIPPIRSQLTLRYAHDVSVRSRPLGQLFYAGLSFAAWRPKLAAAP
ncbi:MAG: SphA family protein [Myxococcales bacterium]